MTAGLGMVDKCSDRATKNPSKQRETDIQDQHTAPGKNSITLCIRLMYNAFQSTENEL